jgi:type IV pilus biogenesis protein CpaD/CtpE
MKKITVVALLALLLAGCANTKLTDPLMANGAKDYIELLPEDGVSPAEAQEALTIMDDVAREYQFDRYALNEVDHINYAKITGENLLYVRCYVQKTDAVLSAAEVLILGFYSKSGHLQIQVSDDSRWANSLMARRVRFEIAHRLENDFGKDRVLKKRVYNYRSRIN